MQIFNPPESDTPRSEGEEMVQILEKQVVQANRERSSQRRFMGFNWVWLLATVAPMATVAAFNWLMDPYAIYVSPTLPGINDRKVGLDQNDRMHKAAVVARQKPSVVILGSSRTKQGINPDFPALPEDAYNLGLNGLNVYELKQYFDHLLVHSPEIDQLIIGIDFFMFNEHLEVQPTFLQSRIGRQWLPMKDILDTVFSLNGFTQSWATLQASLNDDDAFASEFENGFLPSTKLNDGETRWHFQKAINVHYAYHYRYTLSQEALDIYREMIETAKTKGIPVTVFISPSHAIQWESIRATGEFATFEAWKRQLVEVSPVWDFTGYNSVTTEPVADVMQNYSDSSHYVESVGDWVLSRILGVENNQAPEDFGILLTPETIEAHLTQIRADHQTWMTTNPKDAALAKTEYDKYQPTPEQLEP
jgi:hypothetical protein